MALAACTGGFAQVKVFQNNHVGVATDLATTKAMLGIGNRTYTTGSYDVGLTSSPSSYTSYNVAVEGRASSDAAMNTGRSIGVRGIAGKCTNGYNYGVMGALKGSRFGTGVFGSSHTSLGLAVPGPYAGYFDGDVKVTGATKTNLVNLYNDLYEDTTAFNDSAVEALSMLLPCKRRVVNTTSMSGDSLQVLPPGPINPFSLNPNLVTPPVINTWVDHLALDPYYAILLADDYPGLVAEDDAGNLRYNYVEVIPLLVAAIRDLAAQTGISLQSLRSYDLGQALASDRRLSPPSNNPQAGSSEAQDVGVIRFSLPENTRDALLLLFDKRGGLLSQSSLNTRSKCMEIDKSTLPPDACFLSVVADGKEIATRRVATSEKKGISLAGLGNNNYICK